MLITQVRGAPSSDVARAQLDAIRTALSVGIGTGGGFALWLAARRQRSTEIQIRENVRVASDDKEHREQLRDITTFDLSERRVTDLYTKAVEQLGSDKAPVRLGGLYALERLGNGNAGLRQTIVDVLCAYLRMPYIPPTGSRRGPVNIEASHESDGDQRLRQEELQVRLTAQRILARHLKEPDGNPIHWGPLNLDLRESVLVDLRLNSCNVGRADFAHARFVGAAHIRDCTFQGEVWVFECAFESLAGLTRNLYLDRAIFTRTRFEGMLDARYSNFRSVAYFGDVEILDLANFSNSIFTKSAEFDGVTIKTPPSEVEEMQRRTTWPRSAINFLDAKLVADTSEATVNLPPNWRVLSSSGDIVHSDKERELLNEAQGNPVEQGL